MAPGGGASPRVAAAAAAPAGDPQTPGAKVRMLIKRGFLDAAQDMLMADPDLWDATDEEEGSTLVHWAALSDLNPMLEAAAAAGRDLDARARNGQTPLMWAATRGREQCMRTLLAAGV